MINEVYYKSVEKIQEKHHDHCFFAFLGKLLGTSLGNFCCNFWGNFLDVFLKPVFGSNQNTPALPPCFACELGGLVVVGGGCQASVTRVMCVTRRVFAGRPLYDLGGRACNMDNTKMSFDKVRNSRVAISLPKAAF